MSVVLHAGVDSRCADVPVLIHRHREVALIAWETAARLSPATAIYVQASVHGQIGVTGVPAVRVVGLAYEYAFAIAPIPLQQLQKVSAKVKISR